MSDIRVPLTAAQCKKIKSLVGLLHAGAVGWDTTGPSGEDMADGWAKELRELEAECVVKGGPKMLGMQQERWAYLVRDEPYYKVPLPPKPCNPDGSLRL